MAAQMNKEHVIEDSDIGSPSVDRRPTLDHHPIYHLTIYPWYRTTCSWVFCDGVSLTIGDACSTLKTLLSLAGRTLLIMTTKANNSKNNMNERPAQ